MTVYTCHECGTRTEIERDTGYPPDVNPRKCPACGRVYGPDLK